MKPDLSALIATRDGIVRFYGADAATLARSYAPGKWTMREFLLHLADAEAVFLDRLKRTLADDKPLLWGYDENRWQQQLFPAKRDLVVASRLFAAAREAVIELATLATPEQMGRLAVHSENGRRSFAQLLRATHEHAAHHLDQLRAIAAGPPWPPRPTTYAGNEPAP